MSLLLLLIPRYVLCHWYNSHFPLLVSYNSESINCFFWSPTHSSCTYTLYISPVNTGIPRIPSILSTMHSSEYSSAVGHHRHCLSSSSNFGWKSKFREMPTPYSFAQKPNTTCSIVMHVIQLLLLLPWYCGDWYWVDYTRLITVLAGKFQKTG